MRPSAIKINRNRKLHAALCATLFLSFICGNTLFAQKKLSPDQQFHAIRQKYKKGLIHHKPMWQMLSRLHENLDSLTPPTQVKLVLSEADLLSRAGYPILASLYSAQAIHLAEHPKNLKARGVWKGAWKILDDTAKSRSITSLLNVIAGQMRSSGLKHHKPPFFGSDWFYFEAAAAEKEQQISQALALYKEIPMTSRYYLAARYQMGMLYYNNRDYQNAEAAFKSVLYPTPQQYSPLSRQKKDDIINYTKLALARLYYETKRFMPSIVSYRSVPKDSPLFYDALFEQAWAFFMGGYPNHALGALHGVDSPFFKDHFNPESQVLRSLVLYWMCRYEEARNAIAHFMENHAEGIQALSKFLDRQRLDPETGYQLFEDLISGVSSRSLGVPRSVLLTASEKDSMLSVRNQYAALVEEKNRLRSRGIFGSRKETQRPIQMIERFATTMRQELGSQYLAELDGMKADFNRLYDQAQFLYIELLMSEKDQLLGKTLHADNKLNQGRGQQQVKGWGRSTVAWASDKKHEFWWDEIGFYIYQVSSQCKTQ